MKLVRLEETTGGYLIYLPLLKQDHLGPVMQDHVHTAFGYAQGWKLQSSLGSLCKSLVKKCVLMFKMNLPYFSLHPLPLVIGPTVMGYKGKSMS